MILTFSNKLELCQFIAFHALLTVCKTKRIAVITIMDLVNLKDFSDYSALSRLLWSFSPSLISLFCLYVFSDYFRVKIINLFKFAFCHYRQNFGTIPYVYENFYLSQVIFVKNQRIMVSANLLPFFVHCFISIKSFSNPFWKPVSSKSMTHTENIIPESIFYFLLTNKVCL